MSFATTIGRLWRREPRAAVRSDDARIVVVDTETTGLDAERDAMVSIGAVAVVGDTVRPDDSFEVVVRREGRVDARNAALHGIGAAAQSAGIPEAEALRAFHDFVAGARLVGFHADFDRRMLQRACAVHGIGFDARPWLDLAALAATLDPKRWRDGGRSLDDWLAASGIETLARHSAAGDALATAELYLWLGARAREQGASGFEALLRAATQRKWLGGHG
jgi:DNA polymerase-3 subunit epsilon